MAAHHTQSSQGELAVKPHSQANTSFTSAPTAAATEQNPWSQQVAELPDLRSFHLSLYRPQSSSDILELAQLSNFKLLQSLLDSH